MAKFIFTLNIGLNGGRKEEVEIPDEELEGLEEQEKQSFMEDYWKEWSGEYIDGGWSEE